MTILCYHSIDANWDSPLAVTPEAFERHCEWLARNRTVVDLDTAVSLIDGSGRLPRGSAAVTFDDGLSQVFDRAFPLLRRWGIPTTVFLVAATLSDEQQSVDWVDDPSPTPLSTLTREQVLEMQEAGVRFGSHSHRHADLTTLGEEEAERDLRRSREILEDVLRAPVRHVAYPRGRHDQPVRRAAARAGFSHGFSLPEVREKAGAMAVPRIGVYRGNGSMTLRAKASSPYLRLRTGAPYLAVRRLLRGGR